MKWLTIACHRGTTQSVLDLLTSPIVNITWEVKESEYWNWKTLHTIKSNSVSSRCSEVSFKHLILRTGGNSAKSSKTFLLVFVYWDMSFPPRLLNSLGWHWLTKLCRFQVHNSTAHHLYPVLCVHHPNSSLLLSLFIPPKCLIDFFHSRATLKDLYKTNLIQCVSTFSSGMATKVNLCRDGLSAATAISLCSMSFIEKLFQIMTE